MMDGLPNRVCCALKPIGILSGLLGSQNIHEAIAEYIKIVGVLNVSIKRS